MTDEHTALYSLLVFLAILDVTIIFVVVAHIRYVSSLFAQISALEASTDILLQSQTELNNLVVVYLSKLS